MKTMTLMIATLLSLSAQASADPILSQKQQQQQDHAYFYCQVEPSKNDPKTMEMLYDASVVRLISNQVLRPVSRTTVLRLGQTTDREVYSWNTGPKLCGKAIYTIHCQKHASGGNCQQWQQEAPGVRDYALCTGDSVTLGEELITCN